VGWTFINEILVVFLLIGNKNGLIRYLNKRGSLDVEYV